MDPQNLVLRIRHGVMCSPSMWEVEEGGYELQGQSAIHKSCQKQANKQTNKQSKTKSKLTNRTRNEKSEQVTTAFSFLWC